MPIAAFTFGSFGDITAILQLAWAIRQSLSETGGAVAQVQMLITDIDTFTRALQQIKSALETRASVPADLMNGIALALEQCFKLLLRVKQRIDAYNSRMTGEVGMGVLRQYWAAVAWEILGGKREVDALRAQLSEQVVVIQTLLAAAHSQNLEEIRRAAAAHRHVSPQPSDRFPDAGLYLSQKLDDVRKDAESTHRNMGEMFSSMRELCIRLSATSAPFTFFDVSGAQLLPAGFMRVGRVKPMEFILSGASSKFIAHPLNGLTFIKFPFFSELDDFYLDPNPPSKVLGENLEEGPGLYLLMFLYRHGDEEVAFASPVYKTFWATDSTWRDAPVPRASAGLSEYLRCNSHRSIEVGEFGRVIVPPRLKH